MTTNWSWTDPVSLKKFDGEIEILTNGEIERHRRQLPIFAYKDKILKTVKKNKVTVIIGETGSGKSTQLAQYLQQESGLFKDGIIGITQPRRVAAVSVAQRVAREFGCEVGDEVGYSVRFENVTSHKTVIKFMTDGMLQMECMKDRELSSYKAIIIDEAHERTLSTDIVMGLVRDISLRSPDLRVIVTSATLDGLKFTEFFNNAPLLEIPGKMFPVEIIYEQPQMSFRYLYNTSLSAKARAFNVDPVVMKAMDIHRSMEEKEGDILIFLPGKGDIDEGCGILEEEKKRFGTNFEVIPVYGALPFESQFKIFRKLPDGVRKIVLATNIAETSITIDGIRFVIDPGFVKESNFNDGIRDLQTIVISKAQATQRAGRAGRTAPGKCFRLYSESEFQSMKEVSTPNICRLEMTEAVLHLKVIGIEDLTHFKFMSFPKGSTVKWGLKTLRELGALDTENGLTELGKMMAAFPIEPPLSKMLLTAGECCEEILNIVSMICIHTNVFVTPKDKKKEANQKKRQFEDVTGDHMTLLNLFVAWRKAGMSKEWSKENFINQTEMQEAVEIRNQLLELLKSNGKYQLSLKQKYKADILKVVAECYPSQMAQRNGRRRDYQCLTTGRSYFLHPSSALFQSLPKLVMFHSVFATKKTNMMVASTPFLD